jgi:hypothetical protein
MQGMFICKLRNHVSDDGCWDIVSEYRRGKMATEMVVTYFKTSAFSSLHVDNDHIFSPVLFELDDRRRVKCELIHKINCHLKLSSNH